MTFERDGLYQLQEAVDKQQLDAVLVKDLSRLGRHRVQTALFIDYLRANRVRVLSVTENIDSFNDDDDLIISFKQVLNDYYAKDGSRPMAGCRSGHRRLAEAEKQAREAGHGAKNHVARLENEVEKILMERIEDKENRAVYDKIIAKRRYEIAKLQARIEKYADLDKMMRQRKASMKRSVELLNEIVAAGAISDTHLRMLVVREPLVNSGQHLNAAFRFHYDEFEQG